MKLSARDTLGAIIMTSFGVIAAYRFHQTGLIFFLLLAFRNVIAAYYFSVRDMCQSQGSKMQTVMAYVSSAVPLCYLGGSVATTTESVIIDMLTIIGFFLVTLATIDLGKKMGVAPAVRGIRVATGAYRYFKHPMYVGYGIAEIGFIILSPANALIYMASMTLYWLRARAENRLFNKTRSEYAISG